MGRGGVQEEEGGGGSKQVRMQPHSSGHIDSNVWALSRYLPSTPECSQFIRIFHPEGFKSR